MGRPSFPTKVQSLDGIAIRLIMLIVDVLALLVRRGHKLSPWSLSTPLVRPLEIRTQPLSR